VQGERVRQAVRPLCDHSDASDSERDPVALFEMMNAPIKRQEELEAMIRRAFVHII
jgi:hypothetical protein